MEKTEFTPALLKWFSLHQRKLPWRGSRDIYRVWVSEVMLQQTQVKTVLGYYERFLDRFPSLKSLALADLEEVLKIWEGLGYYSRARHFHQAARMVMDHFQGLIPCNPEEFSGLPGAGAYITAAVMSIACDYAIPVVDGNVLRVYTRYAGYDQDVRLPAAHRHIRNCLSMLISHSQPGDFNQAIMELGAIICRGKSPVCPECPVRTGCYALYHHLIEKFPRKSPTKSIPEYRVSVAIIIKDHQIYIQKRKEQGHLGGLWEFPGGKSLLAESEEETLQRECQEELGIDLTILNRLPLIRHAYSHFRILLTPFVCCISGQGVPHSLVSAQWIPPAKWTLFPFPAANHKIFELLQQFYPKWFIDE